MSNIKCFDANGDLLKRMYQWDINQTILVTGLPDAVTIFHFCNAGSDEAYVVVPTVTDDGYTVKVPNILLENEVPIIMYSYQETGEDAFRTTFMIHIPVIPRIKPADYEFEDNVDHMTLASVDARISRLINTVTGEGVEGDVSAEVIDMRDANDGHGEYETAGDALRAVSNRLTDLAEQHEEDVEDIRAEHAEDVSNIQNALTALNGNVASAESGANTALQAAQMADANAAEAASKADQLELALNELSAKSQTYVDDIELDNEGYIYLLHNGERISDRIGPFAGGGGGGGGTSGNNAQLMVANATGWISKIVSDGTDCPVSITWSSVEEGMPTGDGTARIAINNVVRAMLNVQQGTITINLSPYMSIGQNEVKITIADIYGNSKTIGFSINVSTYRITSSFDTTREYTSAILFPYTPTGVGAKTIHFILDGNEIGTVETSLSGRQLSYSIPRQAHGAHTLEVYFDCLVNGNTVQSNRLYYGFLCTDPLDNTPIIVSSFNTTTATQYTTLQFDYVVYTPNSQTSDVTIAVNGTTVSTLTDVDRTQHVFPYRADTVGTLEVVISSGTVSKTFEVEITESNIHVEAETNQLALYLSSYGRSNNEANPGTWSSGNINCTLSNFNFVSDGWVADDHGITVLRVAGDARVTIPYKPFASDFRSGGKTIEVEFATRDVMNYDSVIMSSMNGGRGFSLTSQLASLRSEQSAISMQYKENEHVRVSFVVEKRSENRLVYIYVNGIISGVVQYPDNDDFSQPSPVDITIGSNDCTIDVYCIRIYDNDLTRTQMLNNWIADTQNVDDMLSRYARNNVYDEYGNIVIARLPSNLPYMIIECPELPQYKGDKKTVNITYVDPVTPSKSFTASGAQADVQGTSSQYYARKNYKIKFKNGFELNNGTHASKYAMRSDSIPTNTFTFKADVASSEGANNVELARLYNDTCVYKTPPQEDNANVRQGIDGFPMVMFWNDGTSTSFLGKYNFNNDKGTEEVFGFESGDESWEIRNNTSNRVLWKSADYTGSDWLDDFEARYPDTDPPYEDPTKLSTLAAWLVSTDREQATNATLAEAVTYDDVTYTTDSAAYRLAKFKAELPQHLEKDAVIFYYLFTELFLMVDSRAKNAFPTLMGDSKWFSLPYDFDTAIGIKC